MKRLIVVVIPGDWFAAVAALDAIGISECIQMDTNGVSTQVLLSANIIDMERLVAAGYMKP